MLVTSLSSIAIFSGLSAGYLILKNLLTNEEVEEVIETNNILKYEYYPVENINLEVKGDNMIEYVFIEGEKEGIKSCIGQDLEGNNIAFELFLAIHIARLHPAAQKLLQFGKSRH